MMQCCWGAHASRAARGRHASSSRVQGPTRPDRDIIDVSIELSSEQKVQLTAAIARTSSYLELYALVRKCGADLDENIAVYAMLQAANLQETVQEEVLADLDSFQQAAEVIDAQNSVVEMLVPCIERHISSCPAHIQLTLVSAMAQLGHHDESIFSAVAHSCCQLGDATGGMVQAMEQAEAEARASSPAAIFEPSSTSATASSPRLPDHPELRSQLSMVGVQLMLSSSAYALVGHYDQQLFDLIAAQVVQYLEYIEDMPTLVNILCAFMDVDHLNRELLEKAGEKLAAGMTDVQPADAASVLLVYAFFRVKNPEFYERLLEVASLLDADDVDAKTAGMLYRGIKLLPVPVPIPPPLTALLGKALERFGMLDLSVTSSITNPTMLEYLETREDEEIEELIQQLGMTEISVRRELFKILTEAMGLTAAINVPATEDGWLPVHIAVEVDSFKFCFLVMREGLAKIKNEDMRLRGPISSEIGCMRQEGWIVLIMETEDWMENKEKCQDLETLTEYLRAIMLKAMNDVEEEEEVE